jgi:hypothetical protein
LPYKEVSITRFFSPSSSPSLPPSLPPSQV